MVVTELKKNLFATYSVIVTRTLHMHARVFRFREKFDIEKWNIYTRRWCIRELSHDSFLLVCNFAD